MEYYLLFKKEPSFLLGHVGVRFLKALMLNPADGPISKKTQGNNTGRVTVENGL